MRSVNSTSLPGIRRGHPMAGFVAEAIGDEWFAAQWNDKNDSTFRPFAIMLLQAADVTKMYYDDRAEFYKNIATIKRKKFAKAVLKLDDDVNIIPIVSRVRWKSFTKSDWEALIEACRNPDIRLALGAVKKINTILIRQVSLVPTQLLLPRILDILARLAVPDAAWQRLATELHKLDGHRLLSFTQNAHKIDTVGGFWDVFFSCVQSEFLPFPIPRAAFASGVVAPLTSVEELVGEGLRMKSCIGRLSDRAWSGCRIFFKNRTSSDGLAAQASSQMNAELIFRDKKWKTGRILGPDNISLSPEIEAIFKTELDALAKTLNAEKKSAPSIHTEDFCLDLALSADAVYDRFTLDSVIRALKQIRGKSLSPTMGAYVIFDFRKYGYVQFLSDPEGNEFLGEIASHKYQARVNKFLTHSAVDFIEKAGFVWPRGLENFHRHFNSRSKEDIKIMAAVTLSALAAIFHYRPGQDIDINIHIPTPSPDLL